MKTHNILQGSDSWHALRASVDGTASEAPAMMSASKYQSRDELLKRKATGFSPEVSGSQQIIFNRGHESEASIRPHAEAIVGEDLYPVTGTIEVDGLYLLASFDGLTMMEDVGFEHKLWAAELADCVANNPENLHMHYVWQMEQQLLVSGAEYILFVVSDGTPEKCVSMKYFSVAGRRETLIEGWKQFKIDVANYAPTEADAPKPVAEPVASLPSINYQIDFTKGLSIHSNLDAFKAAAKQLVENSKAILTTDQDFENAKARIKACEDAESNIKSLVSRVLGELGDVNTFKSDLESIGEWIRQSRLNQDKQVKTRTAERKAEIINSGKALVQAHTNEVNAKLGSVRLPAIPVDYDAAVFRKSSFESMQSAINDTVAAFKIEANRRASLIDENLCVLREIASNHTFLFVDRQELVLKDKDAVEAIAKQRIAEHEAAEKKRIEDAAQKLADEKIAADRAAEAKRIADEKAIEDKRLADEQAAKDLAAAKEVVATAKAPEVNFEAASNITLTPKAEIPKQIVEREIPLSAIGRGRPGDDQIISFIADHYHVETKTVIDWLRAMNLDAAEKRLAA